MIDVYYWTTPNGHKLTMFLEETGLPIGLFPTVCPFTVAQVLDPGFWPDELPR